LIQARYSWADDIVNTLPFARFDQLTKSIAIFKREEEKARMSEFAFLAFQLGAGGTKNFGEYFNSLGLGEHPPEVMSSRDIAALQKLSKEKV